MKNIYFILFFLFIYFPNTDAQQIHWADEVVSFSSEFNDAYRYFAAEQILGVPNAISEKDLSPWAWKPKKPNSGKEYIRVKFDNAIRGVRQVYVSESTNPGSITKIILHDSNGKKHTVYENKNPKPIFRPFRMFKTSFSPINSYVKECTVEINTKDVPGAHLDAIGITNHTSEIKIRKQINNIQYSTPVPDPENLGQQVNSRYTERLPIISPDGNTLYFTRKYHPDNMGSENRDDIWVSQRMPDGRWGYAENIGTPLNNDDHNYVVAINPTGTNIYLGNKYRSKEQGLSISSPKRGVWNKPLDMRIDGFYNDNVFAEYHISVDEKVLLLSIQRNEGFGERDIYVSFSKGEGRWSTPKNLGSKINTENIENSVFLAADGKTLYFCSNGHYNYGGLDVFMSQRLDDSWTNWTEPKNLGPKINTNGNDFNFSIPASGEYAYFSSEDNSYGESDLFRIRLPKEARPAPVMLMTGQIVDITTNKPIQAKVKYNPLDKVNKKEDKKETKAKDDGTYQVIVPYGKDMEVYADIEGYFPVSESMELSNTDLEELDSDDPNDPLLNFEYNDTPPSKEEVELEKELARLERELANLKKKKNEPNAYQAPYTKSQANQGIKPSSNPSYQKPKRNPGKDSELEYLKNKYYAQLNGEKTPPKRNPANKEDKEVNDMYDKLYGKKKDKEEPIANSDTPEEKTSPSQAKKEDKEVNDMYDKLYGKKKDKPKKDPFAPDEEEEEEEVIAESKPKEDPKPSSKTDESKPDIENSDVPSFEEIEAEVRRDLRMELADQIKAELRKELMDEIEAELKEEAKNNDETAILDDIVDEVEKETKKELASIPVMNGGVSGDNEIEIELKKLIIADVKEELKEELEAPIKEELKDEVAMRVKKKEKDETQKKMDEWKKRRQSSNSSRPTLKAEPKKDPEYVELNQDIQVVPIKVGQVIPMNNIFFDANKSTIKGESDSELDRVLEFLKKNGNLIVEVGGHTNGWCSSSFADELSRGRAKAVREYFIKNGVPENRIQYRGYGKQVPIASNESLAGRKKNQRVELKILEIL